MILHQPEFPLNGKEVRQVVADAKTQAHTGLESDFAARCHRPKKFPQLGIAGDIAAEIGFKVEPLELRLCRQSREEGHQRCTDEKKHQPKSFFHNGPFYCRMSILKPLASNTA